MAFQVRGKLRAKEGTIELGADVNVKRVAANVLGTDDALQVSGTANLVGATRIGGLASLAAALDVVGTAGISGATRIGGALTQVGAITQTAGAISLQGTVTSGFNVSGSAAFSGTPFMLPYGTASPTLGANGDLRIYHKSTDHRARLAFESNGTAYVIALPATTDGTITVTVGSVP